MVTIREATPADGAPDTQWGYNDTALTFTRDAQGHLAVNTQGNPVNATAVDYIFNADGDPSSGIITDIATASRYPLPTDAEIEARLPFRLNPEDQALRYHVPNSNDTYVVIRRPIYTDRCIGNNRGNSGNVFTMTPALANALAFVSDRDEPNQWCSDQRPQRSPGGGLLRMTTPFNIEGDQAHSNVRVLREALDHIEAVHAHPESESNPLVRSLAASINPSDIESVRGQINDHLGFIRRAGYFIDSNPLLSGAIGLLTATIGSAWVATVMGYITPFVSPRGERDATRFREWTNRRTNRRDPPDDPPPPASTSGNSSASTGNAGGNEGTTSARRADPVAGIATDASVEGVINSTTLPSENEQIRRFGSEIRQTTPAIRPRTGATLPSQPTRASHVIDGMILSAAAATTAIVLSPLVLGATALEGTLATGARILSLAY